MNTTARPIKGINVERQLDVWTRKLRRAQRIGDKVAALLLTQTIDRTLRA